MFSLIALCSNTYAQEDTIIKHLKEAVIRDSYNDIKYMNEVQGTMILSGKKNEVIRLSALDADLSTNNARQIFGKVPGVSIWESDGSGIQLNIATRGLSPNRSWEFNIRQNGYDIASEAFGYPEAYYTPPMEALEKIEVIRGAASLQFGTQFGGMVNFVTKKKLTDKVFGFESSQTMGSYGLFNSFNAVGGKIKKFSYYGYAHHRNADGWRTNSLYKTNTGFINLGYEVSEKMRINLEYTHMNYLSQQPGGLTDIQFEQDPQQSLRSRNWMSTPWNSSALTFEYDVFKNTKLNIKAFSTNAQRNSVGFVDAISTPDKIIDSLDTYSKRRIDRDWYNNQGVEARILQSYSIFGNRSSLAAGVRLYQGETTRKQKGIGSTGSDYDLSIVQQTNGQDWANSLQLGTKNLAFFAENLFKFTPKLSITPGIRYELIQTQNSGNIGAIAVDNSTHDRQLILLGIGAEYDFTDKTNFYANYSQGFRPVLFSEMIPSSTTDVIDPNLSDVRGYNADFGFRGNFKNFLRFDVSGFILSMDNRVGTIKQANDTNLKTNIGPSLSQGIETFAEIDIMKVFPKHLQIGVLKLFGNYAFVDARYTGTTDPTRPNAGKEVENSPNHIIRSGITFKYNKFSSTLQYNHVSEVFTDASNTVNANSKAQVGLIPAYDVMDFSLTFTPTDNYTLKAGVNNLTDEHYATRRSGGYPGPGLLPANGRTIYLTVGFKLP